MKCPCCGAEMADAIPVNFLSDMPLGPVQRRLINTMIDAYPNKVAMLDLKEAAYGKSLGQGHRNPNAGVSVILSELRKKLVGTGWRIPRANSTRFNVEPFGLEPDV